ncbi:MAG: hypothetical protein KGL53_11730, partial [Elusimicrobia bacterium]|nr:hypothetical protein [Elusimicrobiota bacterium]
FELRGDVDGKAVTLEFAYAGCREEGRNDYLPPYTERSYRAAGGYGLTVITDEGEPRSEVLLSKGSAWVGRYGLLLNDALTSGRVLSLSGTLLRGVTADGRRLLAAAEACSEQVSKRLVPADVPAAVSLLMLTDREAYLYHEDCDICAEADRCDLRTGAVSEAVTAHSVDCFDLKPSGTVVYDSCRPRTGR